MCSLQRQPQVPGEIQAQRALGRWRGRESSPGAALTLQEGVGKEGRDWQQAAGNPESQPKCLKRRGQIRDLGREKKTTG